MDRLRLTRDLTPANVVAASFNGGPADRLSQRLLDIQEARRAGIAAWLELDKEVEVTVTRIEVHTSGRGAEYIQSPDVKPAAQFGQSVLFAADGEVHGLLR